MLDNFKTIFYILQSIIMRIFNDIRGMICFNTVVKGTDISE